MHIQRRVDILKNKIESCIQDYKSDKNKMRYLDEFYRYKLMGEIILETYTDDRLEELVDIELPRVIQEAQNLD
jgi:hypothetical protein